MYMTAHTDKFMKVKLEILKDVASIMQPFLKSFQTDAPMLPFLPTALEKILRRVMKLFLRSSVVDDQDTALQLIKLDVELPASRLPANKIKLLVASQDLLASGGFTLDQKRRNLQRICNATNHNGQETARTFTFEISLCAVFRIIVSS